MRPTQIILASTSPRRVNLLSQVHLKVEVYSPQVVEIQKPREKPIKMVLRLAQEKAESVFAKISEKKNPGCLILAADTVVVAPGGKKILGKPSSPKEATSMLKLLSGKTHTVFTGYCILQLGKSQKLLTRVVQSQVKIRKLSSSQILQYVLSQEPMDKAGAYGAQGLGMAFIEKIEGSYTNVVGLPIAEVLTDLEKEFKIPFLSWLK